MENVPSTEAPSDFIIVSAEQETPVREAAEPSMEKPRRGRRSPMYRSDDAPRAARGEVAAAAPAAAESDDEFDLSDISAREKSREEIIAAAEAAAFAE